MSPTLKVGRPRGRQPRWLPKLCYVYEAFSPAAVDLARSGPIVVPQSTGIRHSRRVARWRYEHSLREARHSSGVTRSAQPRTVPPPASQRAHACPCERKQVQDKGGDNSEDMIVVTRSAERDSGAKRRGLICLGRNVGSKVQSAECVGRRE